ncbi:SH3 domain-containing protein C23A1.17-like [Triticum urartu]|uniref:SH3 domain-containing protein C23A1.17-like n=1 Tax=Triticum urartu TaxID=4572 RepID=UPI002042F80C|nr:SH3 domain-containing protein C23A1.17-like [Triticum urartu]
MALPASTTSPAASTSSRAIVSTAALEAAGGGAFEVDGWAEVPDFFLGTMVNGAVEDEDGDEDDTTQTLIFRRCPIHPPSRRHSSCLFLLGFIPDPNPLLAFITTPTRASHLSFHLASPSGSIPSNQRAPSSCFVPRRDRESCRRLVTSRAYRPPPPLHASRRSKLTPIQSLPVNSGSNRGPLRFPAISFSSCPFPLSLPHISLSAGDCCRALCHGARLHRQHRPRAAPSPTSSRPTSPHHPCLLATASLSSYAPPLVPEAESPRACNPALTPCLICVVGAPRSLCPPFPRPARPRVPCFAKTSAAASLEQPQPREEPESLLLLDPAASLRTSSSVDLAGAPQVAVRPCSSFPFPLFLPDFFSCPCPAGAHRAPTIPSSNPRIPLPELNPGTSPRSVPPSSTGSCSPSPAQVPRRAAVVEYLSWLYFLTRTWRGARLPARLFLPR